jgi:hypothetical protein
VYDITSRGAHTRGTKFQGVKILITTNSNTHASCQTFPFISSIDITTSYAASQNMADGTLSLNSRELKDGQVIDITELAPEVHGIAQDVEDILDANQVSPSVVNDEEPPLKQARAGTPPSTLPGNKGKGRAQTSSEDSVIVRPRHTSSRISQRDPSHDDDRP